MRWIVRGDFEVESPMSVHTGNPEDPWPTTHPAAEINDLVPYDEKKSVPPVQGIELDAQGHPVLPASAIKGLLRGLASECINVGISEEIKRLFGELPASTGQENQQSPTGGMVEVRAARLAPGTEVKTRPAPRGKTELFEGTRTADDGQLRHDRVVAPGTRLRAEFVLTRGTRADVEVLLGVLALVDGESSRSALGCSTSQGDGRVKWEEEEKEVLVFGRNEALEWLKEPTDATWESCAKKVEVEAAPLSFDAGVVLDIPLTIQIDGHFLVSAWGTYEGEDDKGDPKTRPIRRPFRVAAEDEGTARLPGSSLDGALRAQARRIFRTMSGDAAPWDGDDTGLPEAFGSLFGSAKQASFLEVETLVATGLTAIRQEFVAIDRFSGGVAGDKKFALEAFEQPELTGAIRLRLSRRVDPALTGKQGVMADLSLTPAAVGLLALVLKDLATGDIPLGHATRKGYGGVRKLTSQGADWKAVLRALGEGIVANADAVEGFGIFRGRTGEDALRHAVELLQAEALTWIASRPAAQAGGSQ